MSCRRVPVCQKRAAPIGRDGRAPLAPLSPLTVRSVALRCRLLGERAASACICMRTAKAQAQRKAAAADCLWRPHTVSAAADSLRRCVGPFLADLIIWPLDVRAAAKPELWGAAKLGSPPTARLLCQPLGPPIIIADRPGGAWQVGRQVSGRT